MTYSLRVSSRMMIDIWVSSATETKRLIPLYIRRLSIGLARVTHGSRRSVMRVRMKPGSF